MTNTNEVPRTSPVFRDTREAVGVVKDDLQDIARQAGSRVREVADNAAHSATDATAQLTAKVQDKPLQYMAGAVGIGFVLGMLFRR
jgi:ElaB/YqjD/DUF883 family membrane-anchored ribosome-binding protein